MKNIKRKTSFMRINPGDKVRITGLTGPVEDRTGVIISPEEAKMPYNENREVAVKLDSGKIMILPRMRAIKASEVIRELLKVAKLLCQ
jgi:hypothetical protein